MNEHTKPRTASLAEALRAEDSSVRLQAALTAGTHPDPAFLEVLVDRCAVEPDFYVRDMLTWALTRLPHEEVLDRVLRELSAETPQARSQAMHTISKLGDPRAWPHIDTAFLHDADTETARTAWRTAAGLAPLDEHTTLAAELLRELGRGDRETQKSLSRAFVELADAAEPLLRALIAAGAQEPMDASSTEARDPELVLAHAQATLRLIEDPESSFTL